MAKPRVFVSSTYYDLKHLRSAFEGFLESFGFEVVLSEKGSVAYSPDVPLDESCYREVEQADILVLVVGGRYGSEASGRGGEGDKDFYSRYDSITCEEFRTAVKSNIPIYVLIERAVYAEYHTFLRNRDAEDITYAHVDSVNIFRMIDEIMSLPRNNPVFPFDRYHEIEVWLREQWASLFRELLRRSSSQERMTSLSIQVAQLEETNKTMRKYLESLMTQTAPTASQALIDAEGQRLRTLRQYRKIRNNGFVEFLMTYAVSIVDAGESIASARSIKDLFEKTRKVSDHQVILRTFDNCLKSQPPSLLRDVNKARDLLGLGRLTWGITKKKAQLLAEQNDEEAG